MKRFLHNVYNLMALCGIDLIKAFKSITVLPFYFHDRKIIKQQMRLSKIDFPFGRSFPILWDRFSESGETKGHYFHQDLLIARKIFQNKPNLHVDIGSRIDGFVAHVASFRKIEIFDIRLSTSSIYNVTFTKADLMGEIENSLIEYCDSISSLHVLEHFGLGRYGDSIKYDGYLDGLDNIHKILKKGGKFYFSVPIGPQRIEFNAHRVFCLRYLLDLLNEGYKLNSFSYVDDNGDLHENVILDETKIMNNYGCYYGCGIFEMTKL